MTAKAIQILDNNPDGYLLVVESGRIDHAHHAGNAYGALMDTVEYSNAVQTAVNLTSQEDTLIIVTADHSHVMTMGGYVTRGNPILGKAVYSAGGDPQAAADSLPFTTVTYTNGRGFCDLGAELTLMRAMVALSRRVEWIFHQLIRQLQATTRKQSCR